MESKLEEYGHHSCFYTSKYKCDVKIISKIIKKLKLDLDINTIESLCVDIEEFDNRVKDTYIFKFNDGTVKIINNESVKG